HALLLAIEERRRNGATRIRPYSESEVIGDSAEDERTAPSPSSDLDELAAGLDEAVEADEVTIEDPAEPDWDFVEEVVVQLRSKLDSMGPVNIDAIEEFDELEEHYRFNVQQLQDLENSKEELLRMIARINRDTRKMFSETFEQIRKNFRDMFR